MFNKETPLETHTLGASVLSPRAQVTWLVQTAWGNLRFYHELRGKAHADCAANWAACALHLAPHAQPPRPSCWRACNRRREKS